VPIVECRVRWNYCYLFFTTLCAPEGELNKNWSINYINNISLPKTEFPFIYFFLVRYLTYLRRKKLIGDFPQNYGWVTITQISWFHLITWLFHLTAWGHIMYESHLFVIIVNLFSKTISRLNHKINNSFVIWNSLIV